MRKEGTQPQRIKSGQVCYIHQESWIQEKPILVQLQLLAFQILQEHLEKGFTDSLLHLKSHYRVVPALSQLRFNDIQQIGADFFFPIELRIARNSKYNALHKI